MAKDCPFCSVSSSDVVWSSDLAFAIRDRYPVTEGHTLVIPRRHVETYFDASGQEQAELWRAVEAVKAELEATLAPDGYNVGFNVGAAAGQTVMHLHVHVIPRHSGDVDDPRGGVRHVIPGKGNYLAGPRLATGLADPLSPHLFADLDEARHADLAVAFILRSGLARVLPRLEGLLQRPGARVRILTGDYQDVTDPAALRWLLNLQEQTQALGELPGTLELKVFETDPKHPSFHLKTYLLYGRGGGESRTPLAAWVGSSNLSKTALEKGAVEWNLRVVDERAEIQRSFEALFEHPRSRRLTRAWVRAYEARRRPPKPGRSHQLEEGALEAPPDEPEVDVPQPHTIQLEALAELEATREAGNRRGLVVLATGLGKTWLSAFDSARPEFERVLFVAHRDEILRQAMGTFARIRPDETLGLYTGKEKRPDAKVLFASVATLTRAEHLQRFERDAFDYIVVDEFHHASARTYRDLLRRFEPKFMLGLTATPERTDGGDLLGLCHENLVYECGLAEGINRGRLCPFAYFGVPDEVDYDQIPWRSKRFDEQKLSQAVETKSRAQSALDQLRTHGATRTLAFCVSQTHADFMRGYFAEHTDLRVASVHSGEGSDPRQASLEKLESGELDVLFCVDMFNEGLDVPTIDTVLMLRPTESKILWLQQLGRGLRKADGKSHLRVIDYIGNHRVFLNKPEALLGAFGKIVRRRQEIPRILRAQDYELPKGCSVTYDVEALELLERLYPPSKGALLIREWYEEFREVNEQRPTALEAYHCGFNPGALQKTHGSWFGFVEAMGDLDAGQQRVMELDGAFLRELESTAMTRSYKIVLAQALLELGAIPGSATVKALTEAFARIAGRSSALRKDVSSGLDDQKKLEALLRKNPITYWQTSKDDAGRQFFALKGQRFGTGPGVNGAEPEALAEMVGEVLDWRLARYLDEARTGARFKVLRNSSGKPILKIDRAKHELPDGWADVTIDGQPYQANFVKHFVNVVRRANSEKNVLPSLMEGWFGKNAGKPGMTHTVAHDRDPAGGYSWSPADAGGVELGVQVVDEAGGLVDARYRVEERDGSVTIVFMSRGGGRNDEYARGLEFLLGRLGAVGAVIEKIAVESGGTKQLAEGKRVLGLEYPVRVGEVEDLKGLRVEIGKAGARVGRKAGAKGSGNMNKRLRIWVGGVGELALALSPLV